MSFLISTTHSRSLEGFIYAMLFLVLRTKVGKYFIQLCGTTPCMVCGSEDIKATICEHLGIQDGGMSQSDRKNAVSILFSILV